MIIQKKKKSLSYKMIDVKEDSLCFDACKICTSQFQGYKIKPRLRDFRDMPVSPYTLSRFLRNIYLFRWVYLPKPTIKIKRTMLSFNL